MLVSTPSMRNSASAREVRAMASAKAPRFAAKAPRSWRCRRGMPDHLGEQRIEAQAGLVAAVAEAVGAHARSARRLVGGKPAARRQDGTVFAHRLHAHPRLDGVAARLADLVEAELGERRALGQAQLGLDDVHAGDFLGHRVFHLQTGVGLDEGERLVAAISGRAGDIDQKLERPGVAVADAGGETHRGIDDPSAQFFGEPRCRRHFDDLLEVPLHAAFALAEVDDRAARVAEDLHFHVASVADELLDVEIAVAEAGKRLGAAALEGCRDGVGARHPARAATAAAGDGLDHHAALGTERVEERRGLLDGHRMVDAADDRHVGGGRRGTGACLVAEQAQRLHARPDEGQARFGAVQGKLGVLRQEAVARMDGIAAGVPGGGDDPRDVEVRRRAGAVEGDDLVRLAGMQGAGVVARRNRHRGDVQLRRRAHDADGNLPSVRYQELHLFVSAFIVKDLPLPGIDVGSFLLAPA